MVRLLQSLQRKNLSTWVRLLVAWATVAAFTLAGSAWVSDLSSITKGFILFFWIFAVILWCSFGVVREADELAEMLGEPYGTLILTLSIVLIEVILISAVMLEAKAAPTIGRDAMLSVMMIIMNGIVGLSLVIGGLRYREQPYNKQGASTYLGIIVPLTVIALILPSFITSTGDGTFTPVQAISFSVLTIILYAVFLTLQTGQYRYFFIYPPETRSLQGKGRHPAAKANRPAVIRGTILIVLYMLPIVLLSKYLAIFIDLGIASLGAPATVGGFVIALIVFTPESITAVKAAWNDELQRTINLCLGAFVSTIGLTVPAILAIGLVTEQRVVLGVTPLDAVMIATTLLLSIVTFSAPKTNMLSGCFHLLLFFVFTLLMFNL